MHSQNGFQVAFVYDDDAHREPMAGLPTSGAADGLFGRHVANSEFLQAWLAHGDWQRMVGVVANQPSVETLTARFKSSPRVRQTGNELEIVPLPQFQRRFFPDSPAQVLHLPHPIDAEFGWARHHKGPHTFALSGVTHTISSTNMMSRFRDLVTGPFERYDTLFCISNASLSVIRAATDNYAAFLRERHGGEPGVRLRLAHVPFGVDTTKFQPAAPEERAAARHELGIEADEICVLFVGRLSYASKVHPFPMFRATAEAARRVGRKVNLVLAGWADTPSIQQKFERGAEALAPGVRVTFVDGMRPEHRYHVWKAADIFTSMSDNIQETLGLTILEAQACGLPVVTTDWNGCRENVAPGETGFTIPTRMVAGATVDGTSRHLMGETSYGAFLGETNQTVAVDTREAVAAFSRLFADEGLRSVMGAAGRARVLGHSTWPLVIQRYEAIWREQDALRRDHAATAKASTVRTPVPFPDVEFAFASYPSAVLDISTIVEAADDAALQLELLLRLPITNYVPHSRIVEPLVLSSLLRAAQTACTLATLEAILVPCGASSERRRATLAWLLKYDLLRIVPV